MNVNLRIESQTKTPVDSIRRCVCVCVFVVQIDTNNMLCTKYFMFGDIHIYNHDYFYKQFKSHLFLPQGVVVEILQVFLELSGEQVSMVVRGENGQSHGTSGRVSMTDVEPWTGIIYSLIERLRLIPSLSLQRCCWRREESRLQFKPGSMRSLLFPRTGEVFSDCRGSYGPRRALRQT